MKNRGSERIHFLGAEDMNIFDLSTTGISVLHPDKVSKGDQLQVAIGDFSLGAKVIYCEDRSDGYRLGLHFTNLSEQDKTGLKRLVEQFSRGVPLDCEITEPSES